jgi:hypothetical protein
VRVFHAHVGRHKLVLCEYDFAKDAEVHRTYRATSKTEYGNIEKLINLKPDDDVVIDYLMKNKKRIINTIVKEEKDPKKHKKCK